MLIGVLAAVVPYIFVMYVKGKIGYDDALDTFGVHAIGGTIGAFLTGVLATSAVNPNLTDSNPAAHANGLAELVAHGGLWKEQVLAMGLTLILAIVATVVIGFAIKATLGLRPTTEVERQGLDVTEHQEEGYIL